MIEGAKILPTWHDTGEEGEEYEYGLETDKSMEETVAFYEQALKAKGCTVDKIIRNEEGKPVELFADHDEEVGSVLILREEADGKSKMIVSVKWNRVPE